MKEIDCHLNNIEPFPIGLVVSRFNQEVTKKLLNSALNRLEELNFNQELITVVHVPGAVEIPIVCKQLAETNNYKAIVSLGAVIRGETSHYDYVCKQVSDGCQSLSLKYNLPIIFGILTTENGEQALARAGGVHSDKGIESIDAAIEMVNVLQSIQSH